MQGHSLSAGKSSDFASPAFYSGALGPAGAAHVLPPEAFRSLAFTHLEDLAVWTRDWVCVGAVDEIPDVGDLLPFTIGAHGVHVQRTASGLEARFNKAQHGGCRQVPVQCQTGAKTRCSFTSCGYSRDRGAIPAGELGDGTPAMHQYLGLRPERLLTAKVVVWGRFIFVSLNSDAPDVREGLQAVAPQLALKPDAVRIASYWIEPKANWKLVAQALLGEGAEDDDARVEDRDWFLSRGMAAGQPESAAWLFPNVILIARAAQLCAVVLQPTAIGQTLCRVSIYGAAEGSADAKANWSAQLAPLLREAESDQERANRWGTESAPETIGMALPVQHRPQGAWMQNMISRRMASLAPSAVDLQTFQLMRQ